MQRRVGSNVLRDEFGMWRCKVIQFFVNHNCCAKITTTCTTYHPMFSSLSGMNECQDHEVCMKKGRTPQHLGQYIAVALANKSV